MFCDYMYKAMIGCSKRTILIENVIITEHILPSYSSVCKNDQNNFFLLFSGNPAAK